jgi:hypothetical protein
MTAWKRYGCAKRLRTPRALQETNKLPCVPVGVQGADLLRHELALIVDHEALQRRERVEGVLDAFDDGALFRSVTIHIGSGYWAAMAAMYSVRPDPWVCSRVRSGVVR